MDPSLKFIDGIPTSLEAVSLYFGSDVPGIMLCVEEDLFLRSFP